jgi:hypothetical protein
MEDGDDANHPARAEIRYIPEWIVHFLLQSTSEEVNE